MQLDNHYFFSDVPTTTEIYTLSLHDALPISAMSEQTARLAKLATDLLDLSRLDAGGMRIDLDRKSTRLNSSHRCISYAVFCLKKKINDWDRAPLNGSSACLLHSGVETEKDLS